MSQFQIEDISFGDTKTWDLICSGFTKGMFQCESRLVQHWLKLIKPRNLWQLSAVIAIVRPGPLQSGFADEYVKYCDPNAKFETFGNPIIDEIFEATNHVMIYQEQIMALGARLAWCHLPEKERLVKVDGLRKAVGKKDQAKLLAVGKDFVEGCVGNKLSQELANKLFEIIKNCGRYVFNLSHSMSYARVGYLTAYMKCHHPLETLTVYLTYAKFKKKDKWEELQHLIKESKIFGIEVKRPNVNSKNEHFKIEKSAEGDKYIRFGLGHMKFFGSKTMDLINKFPTINDWRQVVFACCSNAFGGELNSRSAEALIVTGAFSDCGLSRQSLLNIVGMMDRLSPKEKEWVLSKLPEINMATELAPLLNRCADEISVGKREEKVRSEAKLLNVDEYDHPSWIEEKEKNYLGYAITATAIDGKNVDATDKCFECYGDIAPYTVRRIAAIIDDIKITETKKGKNPGLKMAIIGIHDSTGSLEKLPIFPEQFAEVEDILIARNTVIVQIKMGQRGWVVENVSQI